MSITSESSTAIKYLAGYRGLAILNISLLILTGVTEGVGLGMIVPLLDSLSEQSTPNTLSRLAAQAFEFLGLNFDVVTVMIFFVCAMLLRFCLQATQMYISRLMSSSITRDLRDAAFDGLMQAPLSFHQRRSSGDTVATIFTSSQSAGGSIESLFIVLSAMMFCLVYLILNLTISATLTGVAIALIVVSGFLIRPRVRIGFSIGQRQKELTDSLTSFLVDKLGGIKTIKAYALERILNSRFNRLTSDFQKTALGIQKNRIIADAFLEPLVMIMAVALTAYAVTYLDMPIILLATFFLVLVRMVPQMKLINGGWLEFVNQLPHFSRVEEIIRDARSKRLPDGEQALESFHGEIVLDGVSYTHAGADVASMKNINLTISPRTTTAIVGESGAGKTTLVDMIIGHYVPTAGTISVNGADLKSIRRADWRQVVSVVDQEAHLFNATLGENIRFGNWDASDDDIRTAASLAHADTFIDALPEGYETIVGDRGARFSGGQRQRIALARALVRNPSVLVLDEATSALDSESERLIQEALKSATKDKTVIVIAHRLSTVLDADKIIVMDNGEIVGEGTHEELSKSNPIYENYVRLQFSENDA